jgi:hypothetical protein
VGAGAKVDDVEPPAEEEPILFKVAVEYATSVELGATSAADVVFEDATDDIGTVVVSSKSPMSTTSFHLGDGMSCGNKRNE